MAKNPPIVIKRGKGWNSSAWESFKPAFENAAEQAEQGFRAIGISFAEWKLGAINRCGPLEMKRFEGLSIDESSFSVSVRKDIVAPTRHDIAHWAGIITHEVAHCTRFEHELGGTVLRLAASEGLAYGVEQKFSCQGKGRRRRFFDFEMDVDPLITRRALSIINDEAATVAETAWLYQSPYDELRNIDYFGMQRVQQLLGEGRVLRDLMAVPAEEIFGL